MENVERSDEGEYICSAANGVGSGEVSDKVFLAVQRKNFKAFLD